jgi:hypothetical protein
MKIKKFYFVFLLGFIVVLGFSQERDFQEFNEHFFTGMNYFDNEDYVCIFTIVLPHFTTKKQITATLF